MGRSGKFSEHSLDQRLFFQEKWVGKVAYDLILQESDKPKLEVLVCFVSLIDIRIRAFWQEAMILVGEKCVPAGSHA
ncbi:MAG: hypothetical protein IPM82_04635 [Saprospiraceae bacterium]|nr:hypothetical protein [Saprospiraceae bacterium]